MSFTLVHDHQIKKFCYWEDGVCQGMRYDNELYRHGVSLKEEKRLDAYSISGELQDSGSMACLTVSSKGYSVWQNLRTQ